MAVWKMLLAFLEPLCHWLSSDTIVVHHFFFIIPRIIIIVYCILKCQIYLKTIARISIFVYHSHDTILITLSNEIRMPTDFETTF